MGIIENTIHFIWVGGTIPKAHARLILSHLEANYRHYKINLWTNNPSGNEKILKEALMSKQFKGGKFTEKNIKSIKETDGLTLLFLDSEGPYPVSKFNNANKTDATGTYAKKFTSTPKRISIRRVSSLFSESQQWSRLKQHYENSLGVENYGRASDILRLMILYLKGGIYMDIDVKSASSLPPDITAANDFLMGLGQDGFNVFTNAVMAAPSKSLFVKNLIKDIEFNFYLVGKKNSLAKSDMQVQKSRLGLALAKGQPQSHGTDVLRYTRNTNLLNGTLAITGPVAVELAIYRDICFRKNIHERNPKELLSSDSTWSTTTFASISRHFLMGIARPVINSSGLKDQYIFPMDYIEIGSANSWIV